MSPPSPSHRLHERAIVRIAAQAEGEDARSFLQGLVTNDVTGSLPVYAGLLTPQGKTLFDFLVWPGADGEVRLDCEAEAADELVKRLLLYRLRRPIAIARDATLGVFWDEEPGGDGVPDPRLGALGGRRIAPVGSEADAQGADASWRTHRLALGVTEGRAELGDILWLETNATELNGVSFSKGCYIGQENTARMNWRQKVNRRLVVVPLARSDEKRRKAGYPGLGLAVDHLRVADIPPDLAPGWMRLEGAQEG